MSDAFDVLRELFSIFLVLLFLFIPYQNQMNKSGEIQYVGILHMFSMTLGGGGGGGGGGMPLHPLCMLIVTLCINKIGWKERGQGGCWKYYSEIRAKMCDLENYYWINIFIKRKKQD